MRRIVLGSLSVVVLFLFVYCAAAAWLPGARPNSEARPAAGTPNEASLPPITTIDEASREIRALEARSKGRHDHLLEDTQALAGVYDGLVEQNADRLAEIAALKQEIANIRSELSALKAAQK